MKSGIKADIYFIQFLKDDAESVGGGGIGTLISYLCPLLEELGHEVSVYQCAGRDFDVRWRNTRVIGVSGYPGAGRSNEKVVQNLRDIARGRAGTGDRMEIFAGDFFAVRNQNPLAICVQNGLSWDAPIEMLTPNKMYHNPIGEKVFRYRCQMRGLRRFETCYNRVAVDLYFLNWYRSFRGSNVSGRLFYNPNPAPVADWSMDREGKIRSHGPLKIIFARRFVPEKGSRLIIAVFKELLEARPNIEITLAGEGADEQFLRDAFAEERRVTITSYRTEEALEIHQKHDIAVIPSLCGEATCLSVLEAMSAGCAVVATNMGGTITEIIDGFNGILCWPNSESLLKALFRVIDYPDERSRMQKLGWETSQKAYSMDQWRKRWKEIVSTIIDARNEATI